MAAMRSILLLLLVAVTLLPQEISHNTSPQVIHKADPEYTSEALEAKLVGTVILSVVVDTEGNATEIKVIKGLGNGLDEKAVECLQKWHFKPATRNGERMSVKATIEVNLRLPPV
jgi:periplasmic protein TonB